MMQKTYQEALLWASSLLSSKQMNRQIARWILLHLIQIEPSEWLQYMQQEMKPTEWLQYESWMMQVLEGKPYQYIVGLEDFYGRTFKVNPNVLIPRPETELLVEKTLRLCKELWPEDHIITGVDVGTGSGVIAISLDLEAPNIEMTGLDISEEALQVAIHNGKMHHSQVRFIHSDMLQTLLDQGKSLDLIISNPPYIPYADQDNMDRNVVDFEPHLALFAEEEGLYYYKKILEQSTQLIHSPGIICFELGIHQAEVVSKMAKEIYPFAVCRITKDYQGIDRNLFIIL